MVWVGATDLMGSNPHNRIPHLEFKAPNTPNLHQVAIRCLVLSPPGHQPISNCDVKKSNEKNPGWLEYTWDEILPSYIVIIINHYQDPWKPTSIMENSNGFFVAQMASCCWTNVNLVRRCLGPLPADAASYCGDVGEKLAAECLWICKLPSSKTNIFQMGKGKSFSKTPSGRGYAG